MTELPEGWMGKRGRKWLRKQARKATNIIEVGVWKGRSTLTMVKANPSCRIWAVDNWAGTPDDPSQHELYVKEVEDAYFEFERNLRAYIISGQVVEVVGDSAKMADVLMQAHGSIFDFIFIDADHSYEGCKGDIEAYLPLLNDGGLLAGHDYHWPGVKQAVDEVLGDTVKLGPKSIWRFKR